MSILLDIAQAANSTSELSDALEFAVHRICTGLELPIGHAWLIVDGSDTRIVSSGIWHTDGFPQSELFRAIGNSAEIATGIGLPRRVVATQSVAYMPALANETWFLREPFTTSLGLQSAFALPVMMGAEVVAVLEFFSRSQAPLDESFVRAMMSVGVQLGRVAERQRLLAMQNEQRALAEALRMNAEALTSTLEVPLVLERIINGVGRVVPFDTADIYLIDSAGMVASARWSGYESLGMAHWAASQKFHIDEFVIVRNALAKMECVFIPDTRRHPDWPVRPRTEWIRAYMIAPLGFAGEAIGFIALTSRRVGVLQERHVQLLRAFSHQAVVAISNAQLFARLRESRERAQLLSQKLIEVQEAERRHIARELHDEVGQTLTGVRLLLDMIMRLPPDRQPEKLQQAHEMVSALMDQVHSMSLAMRPVVLDDLGLLPALLWLIDRYLAQTGIAVDFQHSGLDRRFRPDVETAAYRITQESLNNIAKYAETERAEVMVWADERALNVQVTDGGAGFDYEEVRHNREMNGLEGMRERAELLGGHFAIEAMPGLGTRIQVRLPLEGVEERRVKPRRKK